jgi:hypothetical protein
VSESLPELFLEDDFLLEEDFFEPLWPESPELLFFDED